MRSLRLWLTAALMLHTLRLVHAGPQKPDGIDFARDSGVHPYTLCPDGSFTLGSCPAPPPPPPIKPPIRPPTVDSSPATAPPGSISPTHPSTPAPVWPAAPPGVAFPWDPFGFPPKFEPRVVQNDPPRYGSKPPTDQPKPRHPNPTAGAAQQDFGGLTGPLAAHVEVVRKPRTYTPPSRTFLKDQSDQNVGVLLMGEMAKVGSHQQYWWPLKADQIHTPAQIAYFSARPKEVYVQFGEIPYRKARDTTNCSTAVLEALYALLGGAKGNVNGVPLTDPRFNSFAHDFQQKDGSWAKAMEQAGLGKKVTDMSQLRTGDIIQTGGHRSIVADVRRNEKGHVVEILKLEAQLPRPDEDWKTRSAIRMDSWISVDRVKSAVRMYDLAERPGIGIKGAISPGPSPGATGAHPAGIAIRQVVPESPADRAGLRTGDIIVAYGGQRIHGLEFPLRVFETAPGTPVPITVWREGTEVRTDVRMALLPGTGSLNKDR